MNKWSHPFLVFNNDNVSNANFQKHLGVALDTTDKRLSFEERLKMIINKLNQTMGVLLKLHKALRRSHQLTLHKAFVRPNLDYGGIIFDQYMTIWCTSCNNKSNRRHLVGVWGTRSEVLSAPSLVQKAILFW